MSTPDFDYCELYVTVKGYFTGIPYVDNGSGSWTANIPYESITINDIMYEPKAQQMSTAKIVFPTITQNPGMSTLLAQIKEGDRVEIYHFQPDAGLPVFGGFIPPGGITIEQGRMSIELQDAMGRGQWERIRPYEDFDTDSAGYYKRAMHRWQDYLNEDFDLATATSGTNSYDSMYALSAGDSYSISQGKIHYTANFATHLFTTPAKTINLTPGTRVLVEVRGQSFTNFGFTTPQAGRTLNNQIGLTNGTDNIYFEESYTTDTGNGLNGNINRIIGITANGVQDPPNYTAAANGSLPFGGLPMPANNLYALLFVVEADGTVTTSAFVNYVQMVPPVNTPIASSSGWYFNISTLILSLGGGLVAFNTYQDFYSIRVRYLVPWLLPASTFNPQTSDPTEFQANNDDLYTFLNNFVEIDFAEYRPIYQPYPGLDLLELDGVGLLGKNASQTLGMDMLTDQSAPRTGGPLGAEYGDFTNEPSFRFEEGWNLSDFPQLQKSQLTHANNIVRMGSGNTDAQNFYDRWNTTEVGNPFGQSTGQITGAAPTYPYFEALINDDRTSLQDVISTLASNDLIVRAAPAVPSVGLQVAEDIRYAFKYRAGDYVKVRTKSLIPNIDQDLRIMNIAYTAGSPTRAITVGRLPYDPGMRGQLAKAMVESWLYTQSGAGQLVLVYPFVPLALTAGTSGTIFQIPLNQFTSGTAITYAGLHWFSNGTDPVSDLHIGLSGPADPSMASPSYVTTAATGTDSGLQNVLGFFPGPGVYYMRPKNFGGSSRTLNSLFLILKIKV